MKNILKKLIVLYLTVTMVICSCGCNAGKYADIDEDKLLIVTTLFPQYDFAKQIAGDKAEVVLLLSPGVESHDFEPTPSDIILINKADLFIYTGDEMEPWVAGILESIDNTELKILDVSQGIDVICEEENHEHNHVHEESDEAEEDSHGETEAEEGHIHEETEEVENNIHEETEEVESHIHEESKETEGHIHEEAEEEEGHIYEEMEDTEENIIFSESGHDSHDHSHSVDPHIWTSPVNAMQMVENIEQALVELDPDSEILYEGNAHEYICRLQKVDNELRQIVEASDKHIIYFGGRFAMSYFAQEYGLNYAAAFDSCQAESEPSARLIVKIIEKMQEDGAKYVFYEEMTDPKAARIIAEEIGGEILLLHSCHNVSKAEMEEGVTYLSLMEQNVENLRKALQ